MAANSKHSGFAFLVRKRQWSKPKDKQIKSRSETLKINKSKLVFECNGTKALANNKLYLPLSKLSHEENRQFIEFYKSYPCLWDVNHIDYRFKGRRLESTREMMEAVNKQMQLNLTLDELKNKLYYIRYAFTQEKHRQIEAAKLKTDHKPLCQLYNELAFLKDSVGPFKCEYCEQLFNGPDQYKMHKSTHDGSMPYNCPICHKGFMKVGNCTVHLRRHTKDYQFDCKECAKKFPTSTDLSVHMRQHTGEKPYFCDVCGQSFRTWTYFDSHKKRHEKNPSHKCSICSKGFYERNKLKDHMKSHLNVRDKICNVCGKSFTCTKYLSQHRQIHSEKKRYSCKICNKTFAQYGGLSGHVKSHGTTDYTPDKSVESGRFVQTAFGENKSFIEISEPYEYDVFVAEAAMEFNINNAEDIVVSVNGTKMKRPQFKSIVLQYSNTPSFQFDITIKDSVQYTSWYDSGTESLPTKSIINSVNIPDIHSIKSLKTVHNLLIEFLAGKPLRNKDRVNIAKAIIDECLKDIPNRVLSREDFTALAEAIVSIFDSEVVSAYYIPSMKSYPARGKLWSAYNNKRTALSLNGIISRRSKINLKRKSSTSPSSSVETVFESIQYLQQQNISDWSTILCKWSETHGFRMSEIKNNITTYDYITKYPGLQGVKGIELVNMDVLILYPSSSTVDNWLTLYPKVISRARILRDKNVCQLISEIDGSSDERFRAQLTLMLIPYILQHCGKRSENNSGNATKFEIQERFIKEYKSTAELNEDTKSADLQFRFVKDNDAVTYAEFKIAGYTFKCKDLLEALNIGFMYITALNVTYPKLCTHVWQFIQLSIFQIHLPDIKVPNIETIVNDLYKEI